MIKKYNCLISQFKSEQGAKRHLVSKVNKEWKVVEKVIGSKEFSVENRYEFEYANNMIFFVKNHDELFYCGPLNVRRKKLEAYTLWSFDYCFYLQDKYYIINNMSYIWDTLEPNCMPKELIYNPFVVANINGTLQVIKAKKTYNVKDILDIYMIDMLPDRDSVDRKYTLTFYINGIMSAKIREVNAFEPSLLFPNIIYYKTIEQKYIVYDYIQNEKCGKCMELESYYRRQETEDFWKLINLENSRTILQTSSMNDKQQRLFDNRISLQTFGYIEYYFATSNAISEIIVNNYFGKYANIMSIPSMMEDDFSHNYRIRIDPNNNKLIYLWLYFCKEQMVTEPSVCGIEIGKLIRRYMNGENTNEEIENVVKLLNKKYSNKKEIIKLWMLRYPYKAILSVGGEYLKYGGAGKEAYYFVCENQNTMHKEYNAVVQKLIEQGKISPRWKSEFSLYMLTKSYFPNAIYQYHSNWLQGQSLDIFIPDNKVAIEYQGVQHYMPIDIFGGEDGLKETQKHDNAKKQKCKKKGIYLFEWHYSMKIEDTNFINMLKSLECDIPQKQYTDFTLRTKSEKEQSKEIICQYDLKGNFIEQYASVSEAASKSGVKGYMIRRACQGIRDSAGKFQWRKAGKTVIEEKIPELQKKASNGKMRKVIQIDQENNSIEYNSIAEAVRLTEINSKSIRDAALGKQKQAGGYKWMYVE